MISTAEKISREWYETENQFERARRENLVRNYLAKKEEAKEAKIQADALKAEVEKLFAEGSETASAGKYIIIRKTSKSRILDTATLKKELPELWTEYGRDSFKTTLTIA